jgi:methylmalonyl-CoA mutase N-terminal domain/subunit
MLGAISDGFIDEQMTEGTARRQSEIESGDRKIVGLNFGDIASAPPLDLFEGNPDAEEQQLERIRQLRRERSQTEVARSLAALRSGAARKSREPSFNLIPDVAACIAACATVGEIFSELREALGEDRSVQSRSIAHV